MNDDRHTVFDFDGEKLAKQLDLNAAAAETLRERDKELVETYGHLHSTEERLRDAEHEWRAWKSLAYLFATGFVLATIAVLWLVVRVSG